MNRFQLGLMAIAVLFLIACGKEGTQAAIPQTPAPEVPPSEAPDSPKTFQIVGQLRPSFYWIALETHDNKPKNQKLLDVDGNVIAKVSADYLKKLNMEGTGRLLDGRIVNFKARVTHPDGTKEIRWRVCGKEAPYGYGVEDIPLDPFRSTAVDPNVIPIGAKVFIPAAKGAVLPDGSIHDGIFTAVDIGDLIQDKKIDIFTSFGDQSHVFERMGLETGKYVDVFVLK